MLPSVLGLTQFAHVDLHLCRLSSFLYEVLASGLPVISPPSHFAQVTLPPILIRTRNIIFEACLFWFIA